MLFGGEGRFIVWDERVGAELHLSSCSDPLRWGWIRNQQKHYQMPVEAICILE